MNDNPNANMPEPRKIGVWTEGTRVEPKEVVIPKRSPESSDDIPTIPDLDDLQDILEKEISVPHMSDKKTTETVSALAEVDGGLSGSVEGIEAALEVLKSYIPQVEAEDADVVCTVDSLLTQLLEEQQESVAT